MKATRFDSLIRSLGAPRSRRGALAGLLAGTLGLLGTQEEDAAAHGASRQCKKKSGQHKKACRKKAKQHQARHRRRGALVPVLTYECPEPEQYTWDSSTRVAQTFTAAQSGALHQIRFPIDKVPGSTGDYVVDLLAVGADGVPTTTVLATATIPDAAVPDGPSTLTASFSGMPLVAGTAYAAALSRPGASFDYDVRDDACAGSRFFQDASGQFLWSGFDVVVSVTVLP